MGLILLVISIFLIITGLKLANLFPYLNWLYQWFGDWQWEYRDWTTPSASYRKTYMDLDRSMAGFYWKRFKKAKHKLLASVFISTGLLLFLYSFPAIL